MEVFGFPFVFLESLLGQKLPWQLSLCLLENLFGKLNCIDLHLYYGTEKCLANPGIIVLQTRRKHFHFRLSQWDWTCLLLHSSVQLGMCRNIRKISCHLQWSSLLCCSLFVLHILGICVCALRITGANFNLMEAQEAHQQTISQSQMKRRTMRRNRSPCFWMHIWQRNSLLEVVVQLTL